MFLSYTNKSLSANGYPYKNKNGQIVIIPEIIIGFLSNTSMKHINVLLCLKDNLRIYHWMVIPSFLYNKFQRIYRSRVTHCIRRRNINGKLVRNDGYEYIEVIYWLTLDLKVQYIINQERKHADACITCWQHLWECCFSRSIFLSLNREEINMFRFRVVCMDSTDCKCVK